MKICTSKSILTTSKFWILTALTTLLTDVNASWLLSWNDANAINANLVSSNANKPVNASIVLNAAVNVNAIVLNDAGGNVRLSDVRILFPSSSVSTSRDLLRPYSL